MLNFINTKIVKEGHKIIVTVYGEYSIAFRLIDKLVDGEKVIKEMKTKHDYDILVVKDGHEIRVCRQPTNESIRGHKTNYSFVNRQLFSTDEGHEFYMNRICYCTNDYNVKDECKDGYYEPRIHLY